MTIDAIKSELTKRLREVRSDSLEFSESEHFSDLRRLTADALGEISAATTVEEIEEIDGLLVKIENCWNLCKEEALGESSEDVLFDFDFELDEEDDEQDEEEESTSPDQPRQDISSDVKRLESLFDKYDGTGGRFNDIRLRSLFKSSVSELENAADRPALSIARNRYMRRFEKLGASINRRNDNIAAKPDYDAKYPPISLRLPNVGRIVFGTVVLLTAAVHGIITAASSKNSLYLWDGWVYGVAGAGLLYIVLGLVYQLVSCKSSGAAARRMSFLRLLLAPVALVGAMIAGSCVPQLGILGALIAASPLVLGGIGVYAVYRLKLKMIVKRKRRKVKRSK